MKSPFILFLLLTAFFLGAQASAGGIDDATEINVSIGTKFYSSSSTRTLTLTFDDNDTWSGSGSYTTEVAAHDVAMTLGKEYPLKLHAVSGVSYYTLKLSLPSGYVAYISNPGSSDLVLRSALYQSGTLGTDDNVTLRVESVVEALTVRDFGVSTDWSADQLKWRVGLGQLRGGGSAGSITLSYDEFTDLSFTVGDLIYSAASDSVVVVKSGGNLRQVNVPQGLADIHTVTPGVSYEIRFYDWRDRYWSSSQGEFLLYSGVTPIFTYHFKKISSTSLLVTKTEGLHDLGGEYWTSRIQKSGNQWTMYDWYDGREGGDETTKTLRKVVTDVSFLGSYEYREVTTSKRSGGSWIDSAKSRKTYYDYSWGDELVGKRHAKHRTV